MKRLICMIWVLAASYMTALSQQCHVRTPQSIRSLQLVVNGNPFLPPVVEMGRRWTLNIGFDEMSHEYHRYIAHIDLCNADWTVNDELFESDFLTGSNNRPIEEYEKSFNTTQLYTHYSLTLPSEDMRPRISGNYRVSIIDEDDDDEGPVATAEFCIAENVMSIAATVDGNTDIDFQKEHQQLTLGISYGGIQVMDPERELHTVVMQNRRPDMTRRDLKPNIRKANGVEFTHQRQLIFPGGYECHKYELLDVRKPNMNIDYIRWYDPEYHATLFELTPTRHYSYEEDQNGGFRIRNQENEDVETTCEYVWMHFRLRTAPLPGTLYVAGNWSNGWPDPECRMEYDEEEGLYHARVYLKQGYYNYRIVSIEDEDADVPTGLNARTDGDFYQTENEYIILVYHRAPGGRNDRLVGYRCINTKQ